MSRASYLGIFKLPFHLFTSGNNDPFPYSACKSQEQSSKLITQPAHRERDLEILVELLPQIYCKNVSKYHKPEY